MCILVKVKWLKTVVVFGFLVFWLVASNHCRLELIPGLGFVACCEEGNSTPLQDKECETDGCAAVESGFYKMEDGQPSVSAPPLVAVTSLLPRLSLQIPSAPRSHIDLESVPLELRVTWQFSFRTAAPPRAPSLVS
jgi:hypothetical protein